MQFGMLNLAFIGANIISLRRRDLVECLLAGGGDLAVKNNEGEDALTLAIMENEKNSDGTLISADMH